MSDAHSRNPQQGRQPADHLPRGKQVERNLLLLIAVIVVGAELIPFTVSLTWRGRIVILIKVVTIIIGLLGLAKYLVYSIKREKRKKARYERQSSPID